MGQSSSLPSPAPPIFRVPGYPVVPALFLFASAAMTVLSIVHDPRTTLTWLAVLAAGAPVYFAWRRWTVRR